MKFSRKLDYGVILLGGLQKSFWSKSFISVREIAEREKIPNFFAQKLAELLRKNNYLKAKRGKDGGYQLVRDPKGITLKELIEVFEEPKMMKCLKSPHPEKYCTLVNTCPSRKVWRSIEEKVNKVFANVTLAEIGK